MAEPKAVLYDAQGERVLDQLSDGRWIRPQKYQPHIVEVFVGGVSVGRAILTDIQIDSQPNN